MILIGLAVLFGPVVAQDGEDDAKSEANSSPSNTARESETTLSLEPLVISATRTERPRFTTPASVSTIQREDIQTIQPYGYQDVFESIPGVSIQGGPRRIAEEPSIRGFSDEQVVIRIDGTRQNFNQAHRGRFLLDPDLIQSVEVLRGASSAVYGSGALGGVFVIETVNGRDMTGGRDGFGARLKGSFQSNGEEWSSFNTLYGQAGAFDFLGSFIYRDVGEDLEDGNGDDILASQDEVTNGLVKLGSNRRRSIAWSWPLTGSTTAGAIRLMRTVTATATNLVDRDTERSNARLRYRYDDPANRWINLDTAFYRNDIDVDEFRLDDERMDNSDFETVGFELTNTTRLAEIGGEPLKLTYGTEIYTDEQSGIRNGNARPQFPDAEVDYRAGFVQAEVPLPGGLSLIPGCASTRSTTVPPATSPAATKTRFHRALRWVGSRSTRCTCGPSTPRLFARPA